MATTYQKRKRDNELFCQCIKELETIALAMAARLGEAGLLIPHVPTDISSGSFITPYNNGGFAMELMSEAALHNKALIANAKPYEINMIKRSIAEIISDQSI